MLLLCDVTLCKDLQLVVAPEFFLVHDNDKEFDNCESTKHTFSMYLYMCDSHSTVVVSLLL